MTYIIPLLDKFCKFGDGYFFGISFNHGILTTLVDTMQNID